MKRFLSVTCILGLSVLALSLGTYGKVFDTTYKISKDSALGKAGCKLCHTGKMGGKLNPYGEDLKTAAGSAKKVTADVLKKVETKDSDGDGMKNLEEIKADRMPGVKD